MSVGTEAKQLVLTGTNFNTLGGIGADVKTQIDWTKLVWDINGDAVDPGVTFALADIASAIYYQCDCINNSADRCEGGGARGNLWVCGGWFDG